MSWQPGQQEKRRHITHSSCLFLVLPSHTLPAQAVGEGIPPSCMSITSSTNPVRVPCHAHEMGLDLDGGHEGWASASVGAGRRVQQLLLHYQLALDPPPTGCILHEDGHVV